MQWSTWVTLYLIVGAVCAVKGPAARQISFEVLRTGSTNKSRLQLFKAILVVAVIFLWPLLVISIIRTEKKQQSARNSALVRTDQTSELASVLAATNQNPVDADILPNASGEFGYTPDNPVPTTDILATEKYLNCLRNSDGQPLKFRRIGSFASKATDFPVDGYRVNPAQDGEQPIVLYFSPYHLRCSRLAPRGFKFAKTEQAKSAQDPNPTVVAETSTAAQPTYKSFSTADTETIPVGMLTEVSNRADEGDVDSQVKMALHFLTKQAPSAANERMAVRWLNKAATQGHARAQYELGNILVQGHLLPWNLEQGRKWMGAAAAQNYPGASERLAEMADYADTQLRQIKSSIFTDPKDTIFASSPHRNELPKRSKETDRKTETPQQQVNSDLYYWNESDSENKKFYAKGQMAALECFASARKRVEAETSGYSIWADFDVIRDEARAIAERRGILKIGEDHGMSEIDGSDLFFDERRAAFINGVEDALEDADQLRDE